MKWLTRALIVATIAVKILPAIIELVSKLNEQPEQKKAAPDAKADV